MNDDELHDSFYKAEQYKESRTERLARELAEDERPISTDIQKWADVAMWQAEPHDNPQKPKVTVSLVTPDPFGVMAMVNAQYKGRNLTSPDAVTDEERRGAWDAATVSMLSETPMEWVQFSINFENVSRAFTHQLVRTRLGTYAQESMRFAVKDSIHDAVKMPPSIVHTKGDEPLGAENSKEEWMRNVWDEALRSLSGAYAHLIDAGMPAEDARGLLPTNILTRIHMRTDIKTLLRLAGMRLCTQAQFEWREVFAQLAQALRTYGQTQVPAEHAWQFDLIAQSFRPVCFAAGKCTMKSKADRYCSIREQVDAFEEQSIPSSEWGKGKGTRRYPGHVFRSDGKRIIDPIRPEQWLADPAAARVAPGRDR